MKKKCIYLCIIIFFVHNFSQVKADNYQTTSPYWSTEKNGPTSKQEAIDMFFKDRKWGSASLYGATPIS